MSLFRHSRRSKPYGAWHIERVLLNVRIRRSTGFADRSEAQALEACLLALARKHGRRDLILAFARGRIMGPELLAAIERHGVGWQVSVESAVKARRAIYEWLARVKLAPKTRADYRWNLGALVGKLPPLDRPPASGERSLMQRGPTLRELPLTLERYARRARPLQFVQTKAALMAFARDSVGSDSDLWRALKAVRGPKRSPRQVQGGLSPDRAREVAERLGRMGPMWWALATTGMGLKEYYEGHWFVEGERIFIHGRKTERFHGFRDRVVPRLSTPVAPLVGIQAFRRHLRRVGCVMGLPRPLTPYAARRTYAHLLELAGILGSRCDLYMGHSPKTMRAAYREHDVGPYLAQDRLALLTVVGPEPRYVRRMA